MSHGANKGRIISGELFLPEGREDYKAEHLPEGIKVHHHSHRSSCTEACEGVTAPFISRPGGQGEGAEDAETCEDLPNEGDRDRREG